MTLADWDAYIAAVAETRMSTDAFWFYDDETTFSSARATYGTLNVSCFYGFTTQYRYSQPTTVVTNSETCGASTAGAIRVPHVASGQKRLGYCDVSSTVWANFDGVMTGTGSQEEHGTFILCDRLAHQGGIRPGNATVWTGASANLPTQPLPSRATVYPTTLAVIEVLEQASENNSPTITVSYTNSDNVAGRTSQTFVMSANPSYITGANGYAKIIPLQQGDTGVVSVESVTFSTLASNATVQFGISIVAPIAILPSPGVGTVGFWNPFDGGCQFQEIPNDACLFPLLFVPELMYSNAKFQLGIMEA